MKKAGTGLLALLAGVCVAHAQGIVLFQNYTGSGSGNYAIVSFCGTPLGGSTLGPIATAQNYACEVANGPDWTVELYGNIGWNDAASSLLPTGTTATFADGDTDPIPGTWATDAIALIPNSTLAGQDVTVQLCAWYNGGGYITSFTQAIWDGVPAAFSATANTTTGGPQTIGPPLVPTALPTAELGNFDVAIPVPEPDTMALGVLGASAFLMRLRRKN